MVLGNPVRDDRIQSFEEYQAGQWDRVGYIVTSSLADHAATGRARGTDIGNGRCGGDILSIADGDVGLAGFLGEALVVRINHPGLSQYFGGANVSSGYAHMSAKSVNYQDKVVKGQVIGTLGMTGADACHLHLGFVVGGVETDPWPFFDQQQGIPAGGDVPSPMKVYQTTSISVGGAPLTNGKVPVREAPNLGAAAVYLLDPSAAVNPAMLTAIGQVPSTDGSPPFYTYWDVPNGKWLYVNASNVPISRPWVDPATLPPPVEPTPPEPIPPQPTEPPNVVAAKAALVAANQALTAAYSAGGISRANISKAKLRIKDANTALG